MSEKHRDRKNPERPDFHKPLKGILALYREASYRKKTLKGREEVVAENHGEGDNKSENICADDFFTREYKHTGK